jgi:2-polyprenyl-3-methyl-5-hydroxy-6-metoxy-1,4-benzoquinol methylase
MKFLDVLLKPSMFILNKLTKLSIDKKLLILTNMIRELTLSEKNPSNSLRMLLKLDKTIYSLTAGESIRHGHGLHAKHKYIRYHNFFIENISDGEYVLDIGCGNGFLAYKVVTNFQNVNLFGIDLNKGYIDFANKYYKHPNLRFMIGNALTDLPDEKFDVVILSNVLEHLEHRVNFLKQVKAKIAPSKYLIRAPLFERDWRVPLMKDLGLDYRLDPTHYIEYIQEDFFEEIEKAGLKTERYEIRWSEIWAIVKPI